MLSLIKYQCLAACFVLVLSSKRDYNDNLTKLWSITGTANAGRAKSAVVNVTSASILIQPSSYGQEAPREQKNYRYPRFYGFKPRAIPITTQQQDSTYEDPNKHKSEILFPGNYFTIAEVKRQNLSDQAFDPLASEQFQPKAIPLIRSQYQRSFNMDEDEEPVLENPGEEPVAARRSIASYFDDEDDDEDADTEMDLIGDDDEEDADVKKHGGNKRKGSKKISKKYAKYMLPLLIAYKLKYFSMVPVLIGGLVLLVGATGMAGFFFALFAAVMGLQKGSY